jgi:C-terminal peptidase prc
VARPAVEPEAVKEFTSYLIGASQLLAEEHIKKGPNQGVLVGWAIRGLYDSLREDLPADIARRLDRVQGARKADLVRLLQDARRRLGKRKELEQYRDIDLALAGIFDRLEPGFRHPTQQELRERPGCLLRGFTPVGIGVELVVDKKSGLLRVVTPIKDSPAHRAGLRTGDVVSALLCEGNCPQVDAPQVLSAHGLSVEAAYNAIAGKAGTKVKLTILRRDCPRPIEIVVERGRFDRENVFGVRRKADLSWDFLLDRDYKIGYIRVAQLQRDTGKQVEEVVRQLRKQGLKRLILDLRCNEGGLLNTAASLADLFVAAGPLMSIRGRDGPADCIMGKVAGSQLNFPMACLVNGQTTRASELVAACLQDHKRAVIVGERTPGDVSIHNIMPVAGSSLCIAVGVLCRANGGNLCRGLTNGADSEPWGVRPDRALELKLPPAERDRLAEHLHGQRILLPPGETAPISFKDRQLQQAVEYLRKVR